MSYPILILIAALVVAIIDCYIERRQHRKTGDALLVTLSMLHATLEKIKEYEDGKG